jgi:glycosyltransferase involved in cell wall biosynthesis
MSRKITKICILLPTHWAARIGGAQYQAKLLVDHLVSTGEFKVYYLARRVNDNYIPDGYSIVKIPGPDIVQPYRFFKDTPALLNILGSIKPDVIYQQIGCAYTGIAAYYAKRNKCRMVWRVSSDMNLIRTLPRPSYNMIYESIDRAMMAYGIRNANSIIVQTPHQGKLLELNYRRKADAVIRNFHPYPVETSDKCLPIKILWVANFKKLKQPEIFIRLAQDMGGRDDVQFIMVGAGESGTKWFAKLEEKIKPINNLYYTGPLPQNDVNQLIAKSHILVNTSQYEGFSNTFIQAWMRKLPVITLNVNPDGIFNHNEIGFCADGDYSRLLSYTRYLACDHNRLQEMGNQAQQYAFDYYSLDNINQIVDILTR